VNARWFVAVALAVGCRTDAEVGDAAAAVGSSEAVPVEAAQLPAWGPAPRAVDAKIEAGLRAAELDRDPLAKAIDEGLGSDDPDVRARAAWTLGRIGGPIAVRRFVDLLAEPTPDAGVLGAVAALVPPEEDPPSEWEELAERLWQHYAVASDASQAAALLLAIARVGGASSQTRLGVDLAQLEPGATQRSVRALDAMAILCRRGHGLGTMPLGSLTAALAAEDASIRNAAAATLGRCAGPSAEQLAGPGRKALVERFATWVTASDDAQVHAGWVALAALAEVPAEIPAGILGPSPPSWRAEVAAVQTLAAHADGRAVLVQRLGALDFAEVEGPRWHAVLEGLRKLRPAIDGSPALVDGLTPVRERLRAEAAATGDGRRAKALALARCEVEALVAIRTGDVQPVIACASGVEGVASIHGELLAIEALVQMKTARSAPDRVTALLEWTSDTRAGVAAAALGALAEHDDARVAPALREGLDGDDVGRVSAAAGAIAARAVDKQRRDPLAVAPLSDAVRRLTNGAAVEARITAIDALGALARSARPEAKADADADAKADADADAKADADADAKADADAEAKAAAQASGVTPWLRTSILPLGSDPNAAVRAAGRRALAHDAELRAGFDASVPASFPDGFAPALHAALDTGAAATGLRVNTAAGAFEIDFAGAPAAIAQASFATLAERKFFDGLTFHRVVPDFVIQGGDPRGDGYGGPGYVMPCEWSNVRYERGMVGVALAGKDTGGSQLFVAHGRPMHLDARYTIIGRVVDGMDVVDAILPYDRIESVEVIRGGS
jgi:cyclophilin family peptidyl-prolyl cis-trans isomerase